MHLDDTAYEQGYQRGWDEAEAFIGRHPDGMPWSALPDEPEAPPADDFERGRHKRLDRADARGGLADESSRGQ
jgi:hypothetical protein